MGRGEYPRPSSEQSHLFADDIAGWPDGFNLLRLRFRFDQHGPWGYVLHRSIDPAEHIRDGRAVFLPILRLRKRRCSASLRSALPSQFGPDRIGRFTDAALLDQLARHRGKQIVVSIHRMDAFARELAFHHQCNEHLPPHEAKAGPLGRFVIDQELHADIESLADTPGPARSLSQGMQRITGLVKVDRREPQQIESRLDQLGMAEDNLHTIPDLLLVPLLPLERWNRGAQNGHTKTSPP